MTFYSKLIPPDTFLHDYMQYMSDTETAEAYDFWAGMWLLSLACGRDTLVARPRAPVFLNIYAIFVAESGITRKSANIRTVQQLGQEFMRGDARMNFLTGQTNPERLTQLLGEWSAEHSTARCAIAISELATFLGTEKYKASMPALLTDYYDCPEYNAGGGGVTRNGYALRNVWLSFLAASTPSWLLRSVNPNVVEGGFTSRCLFIVSNTPKRKLAWPTTDTQKLSQLHSSMAERFDAIRGHVQHQAAITINAGGLELFTKWYNKRRPSLDAFQSSFESREDAHILRCAALLCINDGTWIIQHKHIHTAIALITGVKRDAVGIFVAGMERSSWLVAINNIRDHLLGTAGVGSSRSNLYLRCRKSLNNAEFSALVEVMHELGYIRRVELKHEGAGRPTEQIIATKLLTTKGMLEDITRRLGQ